MQRFAPDTEAKAGSRWEEDELLPFTRDEQLLLVGLAACAVGVAITVAALVRRLGRSRQRESRHAW